MAWSPLADSNSGIAGFGAAGLSQFGLRFPLARSAPPRASHDAAPNTASPVHALTHTWIYLSTNYTHLQNAGAVEFLHHGPM